MNIRPIDDAYNRLVLLKKCGMKIRRVKVGAVIVISEACERVNDSHGAVIQREVSVWEISRPDGIRQRVVYLPPCERR
jgi:hypothetical protein